jgi:hypothetical protein
MTQEALSTLQTLAEQLRVRLLELPEFRALVAIDRTILELSQILNQPPAQPPGPAPVAVAAPVEAARVQPPAPPVAPLQRVEAASAAIVSQNRMAAAIAATIAAKTANPPADAARFVQALGAAS